MKFLSQNIAFLSIATCSILVTFASASAQTHTHHTDYNHGGSIHGTRFVSPRHFGYHVPSYGFGYRPYGYDYRYGTAELRRSSATANVLNANARAQNVQTDRAVMENSVQFLETRLERKRINHQNRFGHLRARAEQVRAAKLASLAISPPVVVRRTIDPATGRVGWPLLLRSTYYAKARGPIDQVFHQRSVTGSINPDHFHPMRDWIELIECELKANVAYYEMTDYIEAKSFLRALIDEARIDLSATTAPTQLAAR